MTMMTTTRRCSPAASRPASGGQKGLQYPRFFTPQGDMAHRARTISRQTVTISSSVNVSPTLINNVTRPYRQAQPGPAWPRRS